ncbi:MAG: SdpI family protein [Bacteroidia bacterium]
MKTKITLRETLIFLVSILPLFYLAYQWNNLPDTVPTHFNMKGEPDDFGSKNKFAVFIVTFNICFYLLMLVIPKIDPKKKFIQFMQTYNRIRLVMAVFMCAISYLIINSAVSGTTQNTNSWIFLLTSLFLAILGNYMGMIKPNYFIGIRTPWTLENETVWRKTHRLGGKLFFWIGIAGFALAVILPMQKYTTVFIGLTITAVLISVVYSYVAYRNLNAETGVK